MPHVHQLRLMPEEGQQFHVFDQEGGQDDYTNELFDEAGLLRHVGAARAEILVVMIVSPYTDEVPVTVRIQDAPPEALSGDHVVEASLRCRSGMLTLSLDSEETIPLPAPGTYRVRVAMHGLATAYDEEPEDAYELTLWPAPEAPVEVLRWWPPFEPQSPPPLPTDRRAIYGYDNYRRALREQKLIHIARREVDPPPELRAALPASYKETLFLFRAEDGTLWEYSTAGPHHLPLLTERTPAEARTLYDLGGLDVDKSTGRI